MSNENNSSAPLKTASISLAEHRANRIYVAGPMTGLPDFNFPAFNAAANELRVEGWHVENPAEHGIVDGAQWSDYMHTDLQQLSTCCAIYLLPGWSKSRGATLEAHVAQALGMAVYYAPNAENQAVEAQAPAAVPWENFPSYLIDHCEGDVITEEGLQHALAAMLANPQYTTATPALPATEDSSAGDLAEPEAFDATFTNRVFEALQENGDPVSVDAAEEMAKLRDLLLAAPQAQPADALDAWQAIGSLPTCDDLIWLYCQDTNTIDGPLAPHPMYEDSWTHWAYAEAPSTATIDAAMAAAQEGGNHA